VPDSATPMHAHSRRRPIHAPRVIAPALPALALLTLALAVLGSPAIDERGGSDPRSAEWVCQHAPERVQLLFDSLSLDRPGLEAVKRAVRPSVSGRLSGADRLIPQRARPPVSVASPSTTPARPTRPRSASLPTRCRSTTPRRSSRAARTAAWTGSTADRKTTRSGAGRSTVSNTSTRLPTATSRPAVAHTSNGSTPTCATGSCRIPCRARSRASGRRHRPPARAKLMYVSTACSPVTRFAAAS
jgi:hypothetical protein